MALIGIRVDPERLAKLDKIAQAFGHNRAAVVRQLIDDCEVPAPTQLSHKS